ncbi:MAG TPA: hypothetical protein VH637_02500 [Streptosporangiaceae bacterium]
MRIAPRIGEVLTVPVLVAAVTWIAPAGTAMAGQTAPQSTGTSFAASGILNGVAATSASNAWAAGGTFIVHWNGHAWK